MSGGMVEVVARALTKSAWERLGHKRLGGLPSVDQFVADNWERWVDDARAAIGSMREPSGNMLRAGRPYIAKAFPSLDGAWEAMISAALHDTGDGK